MIRTNPFRLLTVTKDGAGAYAERTLTHGRKGSAGVSTETSARTRILAKAQALVVEAIADLNEEERRRVLRAVAELLRVRDL